ncbi:MAG: class I SAM-dependent methyltransferase [Chloroflexi bacterium]|nr:class I SAM-dependent methyltransferase [Chloroflexota bacterium]
MSNYDSFAEVYDLFYADLEDDLEMYLGFAERTGGPILEIGAGTGRVALALAEAGHSVVGLELSDDMRAIAQQKIAEAQLADRVRMIAGDMRRFKLDQHFGLVIAPINTFLHNLTLDDQLATLSSIKKHLRPGGLLVLDCFNPDPAHAADDRRLILQRNVIDPDTGEAAQLWLTRSTDWGQQLQDITYFADCVDAAGQVTRSILTTQFRFIFRHEMQLLLKLGGFDLKEVYGSYDLEPFDTGSDKLIAVATPA